MEKERTEEKKERLTLGSLFDGSAGFPLGGLLAGVVPLWASEVEPYAIRVSSRQLPWMKHYGDVSALDGGKLPPVDIITWGSPCQDLSIAGKRAGLEGERSGLYVQAVRIVREMLEATNGEYPKYCIFENVPGLLSSNNGEDFKTCLDMMQEIGFIPDPNIVDAQDFGVPQRRKRVYITWLNVDHILRQRTAISESIILQLLTELLLLNLDVLQGLSGIGQEGWGSQERRKCEDILQRRISLFSLQREDRLQMLRQNLDEIQAKFLNVRTSLDLSAGEDRTVETMLTQEATRSDGSPMEIPSMSIGKSLKVALEESSQLLKLSTISTPTRETTRQRTCFYFQTLLSTLHVTERLIESLAEENMTMYLNFYEWALSSLTEMRGYIDAELKHGKGAGDMEWNDLLRSYKQELSEIEVIIKRNLTDECRLSLFSELEGLRWDPPQGFRTREEPASGSREGIEAASQYVLNDQGGAYLSVTEDVTGTLRAQEHGHQPAVLEAAGFCTEHSAKARGIGYEEETSPTLRAGTVPAALALENHAQDSRLNIKDDGVVPTLTARMGTGGGNVPLVAETYDVRLTSEGTRNWRANIYPTDTARTLDTGGNAPDSNQGGVAVCEPKAFGLCSKTSHSMLSDNPNSGFYEATTSRCLDQGSGSPTRNQGGMVVVEGNGTRPSHKGDGYRESDVMYTLNATEQHAVAFSDEPIYHSSKASYHMGFNNDPVADTLVASDFKDPPVVYHSNHASGMNADFSGRETANTLAASDYKDPPTVCEDPYYIVRRLTPIECARLQGFPDWWCSNLETKEPTEDDIDFWTEVFETHRKVVTHAKSQKTRNQIVKWLKDPYSDAATYKLWGNGVALPNVYFVLSGIVYYAQKDC